MSVFVSVYLLFVPLVYCIFVLLLAAVRNIGLNHSKGNLELLRNKFKRKEDVGNMVSEFVFLLLPKPSKTFPAVSLEGGSILLKPKCRSICPCIPPMWPGFPYSASYVGCVC